jgi:isoleucyl-tRNA synthetase
MQDWLISKKRYWGLALPIYECSCGNFEVIGSYEERKEKAVEGWQEFEGKTPHRPWIDGVKIKCSKCGKTISRILDVGNPWLDAGIVPFSTLKYFEDKNYWQSWYPAEFICESFPGQFKNWFYSLIAMATVLEDSTPFKNVLGYASVKDEKGEEMHKSKGNAIWFEDAAEKMGVDIMRWMFVTSNPYENLNFGYAQGTEIYRRFVLIFRNVCQFFVTYANIDNWQPSGLISKNVLDKWIMARLNQVTAEVTKNLDKYHPQQAARIIETFIINDLSTWYLRRSRNRKGPEFYETLHNVILQTLKLLSPFMPFLSEDIYQSLKNSNDPESVHLCDWPKIEEVDEKLLNDMQQVRETAEVGHAIRSENGIRLRQPLNKIEITAKLGSDLKTILKEELNVFEVVEGKEVKLDTVITQELKAYGTMRDLVRLIQDLRKRAGLIAGQKANLFYKADEELEKIIAKFNNEITQSTNTQLENIRQEEVISAGEFELAGKKIWLGINK